VIQNVIFFDKRIQNLSTDTTEVISSDQKTMRVDAFAKYRIVDGLKYYQSAKDDRGFKSRLGPILDSSLRQVLGGSPFIALLTPKRSELMKSIQKIVNIQAESFGVEIVDVRIMRADLPERSRVAVYNRMRSDREKEAKEIRAEGQEVAQKVTAIAEKEKTILLAEARKKSEIIRGEGDAMAIQEFAAAFGKDPEFFDFYRRLEAYKNSIEQGNSKFVLSSDSDFLKYLNSNKIIQGSR
jgi:membrane protease subunit HflC